MEGSKKVVIQVAQLGINKMTANVQSVCEGLEIELLQFHLCFVVE